MEAEKHRSRTQANRIDVVVNSFGLLLFIFNEFLAINMSNVIHKDRRIRVEDKGSRATISDTIVSDEYWMTDGVKIIISIANLMMTTVQ